MQLATFLSRRCVSRRWTVAMAVSPRVRSNQVTALRGEFRSYTTLAGDGSALPTSQRTEERIEEQEEDDNLGVVIVTPYKTAEEKERYQRTQEFIRVVMTTSDEQESKDMITAAIKYGTLRDHHLRALLNTVHQEKYNTSKEEAARISGSASKYISTPSKRLRRAEAMLYTAVDEGFSPEPNTVQVFLHTMVSECLGCEAQTSASPPSQGENSIVVPRAAVWSILAWAERHGYNVLSSKTLDLLETIVEDNTPESGGRAAAKRSDNSDEDAKVPVVMDVRQNRLDYINRQRRELATPSNNPLHAQRNGRGSSSSSRVQPHQDVQERNHPSNH